MNQYIDAGIDGLYTFGATLLGYMVAQGEPVIPSSAALLTALVTGLVGFANQLRGIRKRVPVA